MMKSRRALFHLDVGGFLPPVSDTGAGGAHHTGDELTHLVC